MSAQPETWRLLHSPAATGAENMALDEAILEAVGRGEVPPTLRLYAWSPPCLSLGYAQPIGDVNLEALTARGWQLVRRPTGGRAILHTDELTYALIAPIHHPLMAGGVLESYKRIAQALILALRLLGLPARTEEQYALPPDSDPRGAVCFEVPSQWEITVNGKKLIGSAQVRRKTAVLQHGSLPLHGDLTRITQVLAFPDEIQRAEAAQRLLQHAATAQTALGRHISWEQAAAAFTTAFQHTLHLDFAQSPPTPPEIARAKELTKTKYRHPDWNYRI